MRRLKRQDVNASALAHHRMAAIASNSEIIRRISSYEQGTINHFGEIDGIIEAARFGAMITIDVPVPSEISVYDHPWKFDYVLVDDNVINCGSNLRATVRNVYGDEVDWVVWCKIDENVYRIRFFGRLSEVRLRVIDKMTREIYRQFGIKVKDVRFNLAMTYEKYQEIRNVITTGNAIKGTKNVGATSVQGTG